MKKQTKAPKVKISLFVSNIDIYRAIGKVVTPPSAMLIPSISPESHYSMQNRYTKTKYIVLEFPKN